MIHTVIISKTFFYLIASTITYFMLKCTHWRKHFVKCICFDILEQIWCIKCVAIHITILLHLMEGYFFITVKCKQFAEMISDTEAHKIHAMNNNYMQFSNNISFFFCSGWTEQVSEVIAIIQGLTTHAHLSYNGCHQFMNKSKCL